MNFFLNNLCSTMTLTLLVLLFTLPLKTYASGVNSKEAPNSSERLQNGVASACRNGGSRACEMSKWLAEINDQALQYNIVTAEFAWAVSMDADDERWKGRGAEIDGMRTRWLTSVCSKMADVDVTMMDDSQKRQIYLLCRGASLTPEETQTISIVLDEMQNIYTTSKVCLPAKNRTKSTTNEAIILNYINNIESAILDHEINTQNGAAERNVKTDIKQNDLSKFYYDLLISRLNNGRINNEKMSEDFKNVFERLSNKDVYDVSGFKKQELNDLSKYYYVLLINMLNNERIVDENMRKGLKHDSGRFLKQNERTLNGFIMPEAVTDRAVNIAVKMAAGKVYFEEDPDVVCFSGEPDLERMMTTSKDEVVLRWIWKSWREKVGPPMKPFFSKMVDVKNAAAVRNGYSDLGQIWREELEMPDLQFTVQKLLSEFMPLYRSLHAVVRHCLLLLRGSEILSSDGPIPAHQLAHMWAQDWQGVLGDVLPLGEEMDLDKAIKKSNWTTRDMLKRAEDFYTSMGFEPMTEKFWQRSYFGETPQNGGRKQNGSRVTSDSASTAGKKKIAKCHGTAANMYLPDDYRMIYCAGLSMEDFYVIHHEMGHIQYYMSYDANLPTVFQDGANSAFQESVGDAIMLGVMSPQHLQRLGLIEDKMVYTYPRENSRKHHGYASKRLQDMDEDAILNNHKHKHTMVERADSKQRKRSEKQHLTKDAAKEKEYSSQIINTILDDLLTRNFDQNDVLDYVEYAPKPADYGEVKFSSKKRSDENKHFGNVAKSVFQKDDGQFLNNGSHRKRNGASFSGHFKRNGEDLKNLHEDLDFDTVLLLRQALTKLPQIPFGYVIDKYRWDIFAGKIQPDDYNKEFWNYVRQFQGIEPPGGEVRGEMFFDAGAKFHVADNTPYVRYFLSSFLQFQMFKGMCLHSLYGDSFSPDDILPMPLHRCDIYGSKRAGRKLKEMMSLGSSVHWSEALKVLTGESEISSKAILEYFAPLQEILDTLIETHNIPVGW